MITYVIPTRDRPTILEATLRQLAALGPHEAEVLVIDNASAQPIAPIRLTSGVPVRVVRLPENRSTSARNEAIRAADPASTWLVMLDDDSCPMDLGFLGVLRRAPSHLGAVAAEVFLPSQQGVTRHEAGGLPEVFVGCGAAIRAEVFRELGGYDASFDYYAEEYDFCARLLRAGLRVGFDRRFRVLHRKETQGRNFGRILANLVRNNAWVAMRYAPDDEIRRDEVARTIVRYAAIAWKERVPGGFVRGVTQLARHAIAQPATPLTREQWSHFTGLTAACEAIKAHGPLGPTALVHPGKNTHVVLAAAQHCGVRIVDDPAWAKTLLVATLSPGPMIDAAACLREEFPRARVVMPWMLGTQSTMLSTPQRTPIAA